MSSIQDALDEAVSQFTHTVASILEDNSERNEKLHETLTNDLRVMLRRSFPGILAGGSSKLICDMPNNPHGFPSANAKHCKHCGADFCDDHALTKCVKCNKIL